MHTKYRDNYNVFGQVTAPIGSTIRVYYVTESGENAQQDFIFGENVPQVHISDNNASNVRLEIILSAEIEKSKKLVATKETVNNTAVFDGLDRADPTGKTYYYWVEEESSTGRYIVSYENNMVSHDSLSNVITVTNTPEEDQEGLIEVEKVWVRNEENVTYTSSHEAVEIQVMQHSEATVQPVTVKLQDWQYGNKTGPVIDTINSIAGATFRVTLKDSYNYGWIYDTDGEIDVIEGDKSGNVSSTAASFEFIAYGDVTVGIKSDWHSQASRANGSLELLNEPQEETVEDTVYQILSLSSDNNWYGQINELPLRNGDITYQYYLREINGEQYEVTYQDNSDHIVDVEHPVVKGRVKVINKETVPQTGALKLTKIVKVNDAIPSTPAQWDLVDGDYVFTVSDGNSILKYVQITVAADGTVSYKVADTEEGLETVQPVEGSPAVVTDLGEGDYTITETGKNGLTLTEATRGDGNPDAVSSYKTVTVHVTAGENYPADASAAAASFTNTKQVTDLEFYKEWQDLAQQEIDWAGDIQVTVGRNKGTGGEDTSYSLVYNIEKSVVEQATEGQPVEFSAVTNPTTSPKLILSVTKSGGKTKYLFKVDNLPSSDETDGLYTYYVKETNEQLEGYIAPTYSNTSAPTGAAAAFDGGTIVNKQEGGYELPSTGGLGNLMFLLSGVALILTAGGGTLLMKRRAMRYRRR